MKNSYLLLLPLFLLPPAVASGTEKADTVLVVKSAYKLYLRKNGRSFKEFDVRFGGNPKGHKLREGDERTPEGKYVLDFKNENSAFYKSIRISYPNEADRQRAAQLKVDPGGAIMIHGLKNGEERYAWLYKRYDWTEGCIAVTNREMDEIWQAVEVGTPIEIRP